MKRLTQIRVDFSDLRDHRFNHRFNCPSPICSCGTEDETTTHFLLSCPRYNNLRQTYLSKISQITNSDVTVLPKDHLSDLLLYGSKAYNEITNELILTETIVFIYKSERFKYLEAFSWFIFDFIFPGISPSAWPLTQTPVNPIWQLLYVFFLYFLLTCICIFFPLWLCDGARRYPTGYQYPSHNISSCLYLLYFF